MGRILSIFIAIAGPVCFGQSVSIATPANNTTINGFAYALTATFASISNAASMEWIVDQERIGIAYNCAGTYCPPYTWNTADFGNGQHQLVAVVRDALNNTVATSSPQSFTISNTVTCNDGVGTVNEQISVSPGTSVSSPWSGQQTIAVSASGTQCSSYSWSWELFVDGKRVSELASSSATGGNLTLQTQQFYNGSHKVAVGAYQVYGGGLVKQILGTWQRSVTFTNTSGNLAPVEMQVSAKEVFLTPTGGASNCGGGSSCTLTGTQVATDGSTTAVTPNCYPAPPGAITTTNTAVATVSGSCTITQAGIGETLYYAVDPLYTYTDLASGFSGLSSAAHPFQTYMGSINGSAPAPNAPYWCVYVSSNTGSWAGLAGLYLIRYSDPNRAHFANTSFADGLTGGQGIGGPCQEVWVAVNSTNAVPHFTRNGGISAAYDPNASIFSLALFNGGNSGYYSYTNFPKDYAAAGWNTLEQNLGCWEAVLTNNSASGLHAFDGCAGGVTQAQWQTSFASAVSTYVALAQANNLYLGFTATSQTNDMFDLTQGTGSLYSPPIWTQAMNYWSAQGHACTPSATQRCYGSALRVDTNDEVNHNVGNYPILTGLFGTYSTCLTLGQPCGPQQIVASGGVCTITAPNIAVEAALKFLIQGATTTSLNSNYPNYWSVTSQSGGTIVFNCAGVPNGTYNASTDPTLSVKIFANGWSTSTGYIDNNAYSVLMGSQHPTFAGTFSPNVTWPVVGISNSYGIHNFMNDSRMANYATHYTPGASAGVGMMVSRQFGYINISQTEQYHYKLQYAPADQHPWCAEGQANTGVYTPTGANNINTQTGAAFSVASFTGDILTVSAPHGLSNIFPGVTRVQLSGMSNSADNGIYYVRATPTGTTMQLIWCAGSCTGSPTGISGGTLHFDNGDTQTWNIQAYGGQRYLQFSVNHCRASDIGHTFTVSGVTGFWSTATGYYGLGSDPTCTSGNSQVFSVPTGSSSSGGTVSIIPDNLFHVGFTASTNINGPAFNILENATPLILGASCIRAYLVGSNPQLTDNPVGTPSALNLTNLVNHYSGVAGLDYQSGAYAGIDTAGSQTAWWMMAPTNFLVQRGAKCLLQPRFGSPDYGDGWLAAMRGDGGATYGNCLLIQSFWDGTRTLTANLSPILISGKAIWKYYSSPYSDIQITQIASGTTSDSTTCEATCTVLYMVTPNGASEVAEPLMTARLADVTNASSIVVRYSCTPWPIGQPVSAKLLPVASLGTGSATLPIDPQLCPNNFQLLYLNGAGEVLATGGVGQLSWQN